MKKNDLKTLAGIAIGGMVALTLLTVLTNAVSTPQYQPSTSNSCSIVGRHYNGSNGPYTIGQPYCSDTPFVDGVPVVDPRIN